MGDLVADVVLFVTGCVLAVLSIRHFATRRGIRLADVQFLVYGVMYLAAALVFPPLGRLVPSAWQFDIVDGLVVLAFLIFFLGTWAVIVHRRQPQ